MKNIGIIYNARVPEALDLSTAILHDLKLAEGSWLAPAENLETLASRAESTDLVITVGGDGTILRAVGFTAPADIPVVGINMGRLGFMTELQVDEAMDRLPSYIDGDYRVDERNMLQATVHKAKGKDTEGPYHALNDVVLTRGAISRVVTVSGEIDGSPVTTFRADGVIMSTATGSTSYNLAVGGPILDPESSALVLKTVAAHMGLSAALVLRSSSEVNLTLEGYQQAMLSVDGYVDYELDLGDRVEIKQSPYKAKFLRANPPSYFFGTLTRRLGFSIRGQ
ncbi:MAG TPA: NAD(+) kinase [Dehalococcoidia bacterium]|nr:NAD(+) kinase [Dehalococcoidia bacterium]|tara:strand:+ start:4614 stop:5456 length:843 start_codon:yes stop_codon:yes gene_type:complete